MTGTRCADHISSRIAVGHVAGTVTPDGRALFRRGRLVFSSPDLTLMFTNRNAAPDPRHHTPLLSIGPRRCRYIVSDSTRNAVCCGAPTISDLSSWCAYHARLVYEPRLSRSEREQRRAA